ncbi:hypothetical protein MP638_004417 [Amoeboaphelidium occidentale]|nr:hypothetical protein MP638_004417 [Amoeboaphelidium occidentale]
MSTSENTAKRKARVQISFAARAAMERAKPAVGDGSIYNIYYGKYYIEGCGKRGDAGKMAQPATSRCDPEKDSGITLADEIARDPFFCVFFAKGCCGKGYNCNYLHRVPNDDDEERIERTRDCFGRERHRTDREDMTGVGSFEKDNKTLHISRIGKYQEGLEEILRNNFGKFGEIVAVKILYNKNMAFVRYKNRLNAEFAKEAMNEQALERNECLSIRWAFDDQNMDAQVQAQEKAEKKFVDKLLENPNTMQAMTFLHDTQKETDLNAYYQQQGMNYSQYLYQRQYANMAQKPLDPNGFIEPRATYQGHPQGSFVLQPGQVVQTKHGLMAPPPPPPKKKPETPIDKDQSVKRPLDDGNIGDEDEKDEPKEDKRPKREKKSSDKKKTE